MKEEVIEQFSRIKSLLLETCSFQFDEPIFENESKQYWACRFKINNKKVIYRKAKITPTKVGQFVTLWERTLKGPIRPLHIDSDLHMVIVSTLKDNQAGQFVFPKSILVNKGIIADKSKEGKRGFRVYPPWDEVKNNQAKKTQEWQLEYFLSINNEIMDVDRAKFLFNLDEI